MPFDFGGTHRPDSGKSGGGLNVSPMPGSIEPSSPPAAPPSSSSRGGFTDLPKLSGGGSDVGGSYGGREAYPGGTNSSRRGGSGFRLTGRTRSGLGPRRSLAAPSIPWRAILLALLVVAAIALLWYFRYEITDFLTQVLSWVIIIVVVLVVLRIMFFGGRRRW